jgi:hypothetical protein
MSEKVSPPKTYTVANLYAEAARMVREEFSLMKNQNQPLTLVEEEKIKQLAKTISRGVLKEMKVA